MKYSNSVLFAKGQQSSTDNYNDFGYFNDGTVWYETPPTYTARVTAYAAATGITDYTILDPLNEFDKGLVYWGLDTIMKALYPMVTDKTSQSDMATQMKYNFMNPLDTNPAFRLNWVGGWIYSRTGALPNGVNAYADTFLIPSTTLTLYNNHLSFYSRTNTTVGGGLDIGCQWQQASPVLAYTFYQFNGRNSDGNAVGSISSADANRVVYTQTNPASFVVTSRTANNSIKGYTNGILKATNTTINTTEFNGLPQNKVFISALNLNDGFTNSITVYSNKQCAFASIGNGLTDFQANIFSTLVNNLQKALNRAVY